MMNRIDACLRLNTPGKTLLILLILWVIFGFCGCASVGTPPQSTANLYPEKPRESSIPGSGAQAIVSRTMPVTFDELFDATTKAAFHRGLDVDYKNMKEGKLSGKGVWQIVIPNWGPKQFPIVFAAYIEEIDQKPTTKLTIVMDYFDRSAQLNKKSFVDRATSDFIIDVQKLLATLR